MGYWRAGPNGESLQTERTGLMWGDRPADAMDDAIGLIIEAFVSDVGRRPTKDEMMAGLLFSLGIYDEGMNKHV